ncbi:hypothetical protein JOS77_09290 [Chromobacterium haemolyticum]|nr:hypothetical protein JOS77_09290 [Chromobacterium haemolyticum]
MSTPTQPFSQVHADERAGLAAARADEGVDRPGGDEAPQAGLAFSGGGIRSATFNLGVLQALASSRWLREFDYLSTVSGGGYLGGWLSALKHRAGNAGMEQTLRDHQGRQPAIQFLRDYSNYLTPKTGLFSLDTLSAVITYWRNFILNQVVLQSLLLALLLGPHFLVGLARNIASTPYAGPAALTVAAAAAVLSALLARATHPRRQGRSAARAPPAPASLYCCCSVTQWRCSRSTAWTAGTTSGTSCRCGEWRWGPVWLTPATGPCWRAASASCAAMATCAACCVGAAGRPGRRRQAVAGVASAGLRPGHPRAAGPSLVFGGRVFLVLPPVFALTAALHIGLVKRSFSDLQREWWSRLGGLLLALDLALALLFVVVALSLPLLAVSADWLRALTLPAWLLTTLAAVWQGQSARTGGMQNAGWRDLLARIGPYVFIAGLLILLSAGLSWLLTALEVRAGGWQLRQQLCGFRHCDLSDWTTLHFAASEQHRGLGGGLYAALILACLGLAVFASSRFDINLFSLHNFYRNRLTRGYLGASAPQRTDTVNRFTGFNAGDDLPLAELAGRDGAPPQRPYHLINTALNLVAGDDLAWQQRKAASFTFTPRHCGYKFPDGAPEAIDAFAPTNAYMLDDVSGMDRGPMLGSLMAVSGAAVSPNQGYHSSPAVTFLLTVFNVRLGRWCPNPGKPGADLQAMSPPQGWVYLLKELLGQTNARSDFVYLSDGGHFENLGLYELLRRECRLIVISDAGQDEQMTFEDLGNAIRKCRIDLGAEIHIDVDAIRRDPATGLSRAAFAVGYIRYASGANGHLLYLKPCIQGHGLEPVDVQQAIPSGTSGFPAPIHAQSVVRRVPVRKLPQTGAVHRRAGGTRAGPQRRGLAGRGRRRRVNENRLGLLGTRNGRALGGDSLRFRPHGALPLNRQRLRRRRAHQRLTGSDHIVEPRQAITLPHTGIAVGPLPGRPHLQ